MAREWKENESLDRFIVWLEQKWGDFHYILAGLAALVCSYLKPNGMFPLATVLILAFFIPKLIGDLSHKNYVVMMAQIMQYVLAFGIAGALVLQWFFWGSASNWWVLAFVVVGTGFWFFVFAYENSKSTKVRR